MKLYKGQIAVLLIGVISLLVTGCGSSSEPANKKSDVKKIIVGTGTGFPNVCFIDEQGNLTGYDVELIREIDARLEDYEFEFQTMDFSNLLLSLETEKVDIVAHQMEKNPEREEKFLFSNEPYSIFLSKVAVDKNDTTIQSIKDLHGKKVYTSPTSNQAYFLEQYNKANNHALEIVYSSGAANDLVSLIQSKRIDATLATDFALNFYPGDDGLPALKTVGEPLIQSEVYFVLRKDSKEFADVLDRVVKELKNDGTLSRLSTEWLGQDFTKTLEEAITQ